ncbi:MAG: hypothetical protein ACYC64_03400 [Armatimonadota bacterium]
MHVSKFRARTLLLAIVSLFIMSLMLPLASYAGSRGSRNTAIGLAGVAAYLFAKGKTLPGMAAAVGAGIAYSDSQRERGWGHSRSYNDRYYGRDYRGFSGSSNWGRCDDRGRYNDRYRHENRCNDNYGGRWSHRR